MKETADTAGFVVDLWYTRWSILRKWRKRLSQNKESQRAEKEILSVYERHATTALCYYGSNWLSCGDFSKAKEELVDLEKRKIIRDANDTLESIISVIRDQGNVEVFGHTQSGEDEKKALELSGCYKDFKPQISPEKLKELISVAGIAETIALLLRYECLCPGGQQWSVPEKWIKSVKKQRGLDLVAFGSPLNCTSSMSRYCSGYPEDRVFDSMGSIFDLQIPAFCEKFTGKNLTIEINPPFIEKILLDAVLFVKNVLKYVKKMPEFYAPRLTILFICPDWEDAEYFCLLQKIKRVKMINLKAGSYSYEVGNTGKTIKTSKNSFLFVISYGTGPQNITTKGFVN